MEKLKGDAQVALLLEQARLQALACAMQKLSSKLRSELAAGNTANLLCRMRRCVCVRERVWVGAWVWVVE